MSFAPGERRGETPGKDLSDEAGLREAGAILERAFVLAEITPQEVQHALGYANQGQVSKWTTGRESAPMHKLFSRVPRFRTAYLLALAEAEQRCGNSDLEMVTTVTVRRRVA